MESATEAKQLEGSGKPPETYMMPSQPPYGSPPQGAGFGNYPPPHSQGPPQGNYGPTPTGPVITGQPQSNFGPMQPSGGFHPPTNGTQPPNPYPGGPPNTHPGGPPNTHPGGPPPNSYPGAGGPPNPYPGGPPHQFSGPPNPYPGAGGPPAVPGGVAVMPGGPSGGNWMVRPQNVSNSPPGLEYLTLIDTLMVNQIFNMAEAMASEREPENQFIVTNSIGQNVYFAKEESDDCSRKFCGSRRAFRMKIFDNYNNHVIQLNRPIACQACCFPCCLQKLEVSAPPGTVVGSIEQEWALLYPTFLIKTPTGETVLQMKGPICTMNCYADVEFTILTADGANEVGKISKKWSGYSSENSAKTDVFGISFPMDLDVRMKAVMLGACFLIDMMYFEQNFSRPTPNTAQHNAPQHHEVKPI